MRALLLLTAAVLLLSGIPSSAAPNELSNRDDDTDRSTTVLPLPDTATDNANAAAAAAEPRRPRRLNILRDDLDDAADSPEAAAAAGEDREHVPPARSGGGRTTRRECLKDCMHSYRRCLRRIKTAERIEKDVLRCDRKRGRCRGDCPRGTAGPNEATRPPSPPPSPPSPSVPMMYPTHSPTLPELLCPTEREKVWFSFGNNSWTNSCQRDRYESAIQLWRSQGVRGYSYRYRRLCNCPERSREELAVTVLDGAVVSVVGAKNGKPVGEDVAEGVRTVDDLFATIWDAMNVEFFLSFSISVSYDETYGYPRRVRIDRDRLAFDDELFVEVGDWEPLPPVSDPTSSPTARPNAAGGGKTTISACRPDRSTNRGSYYMCALTKLSQARELWDSHRNSGRGYSYGYQRLCRICPSDYTEWLAVEVLDDAVVSVTTPNGKAVEEDVAAGIRTIDELFEIIDGTVTNNANAYSVSVLYDETWGYPREVKIDDDELDFRDELHVRVRDLVFDGVTL